MNSFFKVIYATLGGCNVIFNLFSPIAIVILWLLQFGSSGFGTSIIVILGCLTIIYRAFDFIMFKEERD